MASRKAARVFGGGARLRERGWGADAHLCGRSFRCGTEAAFCVGAADQRPRQ
jgi:hypothetical protein